jgi:hypothetical protein
VTLSPWLGGKAYALGGVFGDGRKAAVCTRALATEQIRNDIQLIASLLGASNGENDHAARSQAILTFSALVGAMVLARAVFARNPEDRGSALERSAS